MDLLKNLVIDPIKAAALRIAKQAGAAYDFARAKAMQRPKKAKNTGPKYKPGTIGTSPVYDAMMKRDGAIISRRERKQLAKAEGKPFKAYYNGKGLVRGFHNVRPNKYAGRGRKRA